MAKKKKKKQRPEGYDPNEARRQRLEARRQAKAEAMAARRRTQIRERIVRYIVIAGLVVFGIWFLFLRGQAPDQIGDHDVVHLSLSGSGDHTETVVQYESNPPVSGPHSQRAAPCGTHATELPDENEVHTLEHGAVGIIFQPALPKEDIETLEGIVQSYDSHVFSTPDSDMLKPVVITAWGHMMRLDEVDVDAIDEFIEVFRQGGDAPESFQECPNVVEEEFGAPTPTPTAPPSPTEEAKAEDKKNDGGKGKD